MRMLLSLCQTSMEAFVNVVAIQKMWSVYGLDGTAEEVREVTNAVKRRSS